MAQSDHALLSASKAGRWRRCPASALAEASVPNTSSAYAEEGTAAHHIASETLASGLPKVDRERWRTEWVNKIRATEEMMDAVDVYVEWVTQETLLTDIRLIEHKFSLDQMPSFPEALKGLMFGTADFVRFRPSDKSLLVVDYKHGAGVVVGIEGNDQLRYYALGALLELSDRYVVDTITMAIVQPRARGEAVRCETIRAVDLLDWAHQLTGEALAALSPDAPFVPGKHCQFCSYAGRCEAVRHNALTVAELPTLGPVIPTPQELSGEELGALLAKAQHMEDALQAWVAPFRAYATTRMMLGEQVPGWALVPKKAQRKWAPEAKELLVEALGFDAFEPETLISVAQAEKKLGGKTKFKALPLSQCVIAESSGYNMVPCAGVREGITQGGPVVPLLGPIATENDE